MAEDRSSNTEEPTKRRLDEARSKGDVAKSQDVAAFAALAGGAAVVVLGGGWMARSMAEALTPFLAHPEAIDLSGRGSVGVMRAALGAAVPGVLVLAAASVAGIAGNLIQHGFLWAPSKLAPDLSKLNPFSGLQRMFGLDSLINFGKSAIKLVAMGAVVWMVLKPRAGALQTMPGLEPAAILPYSAEVLRAMLFAVLAVSGVIAGADWMVSRQRFMARMRMSREDVKQESKDTEGDPHVKARQRQVRVTLARRRMIQNVPKATVVVTNPTHYAVALRYEKGETEAPVCVAKGMDALALKIRAVAEENEVPIVEDPPLARALYAAIDVDEAIPREHYQAVAQIIGFIMSGAAKAERRKAAPPLRP